MVPYAPQIVVGALGESVPGVPSDAPGTEADHLLEEIRCRSHAGAGSFGGFSAGRRSGVGSRSRSGAAGAGAVIGSTMISRAGPSSPMRFLRWLVVGLRCGEIEPRALASTEARNARGPRCSFATGYLHVPGSAEVANPRCRIPDVAGSGHRAGWPELAMPRGWPNRTVTP